MGVFIGHLIGFAIIVVIIVKWVVPPVRGLMQKQQDAVRTALAESAEAAKKLADADAMHAKALEDAKAESTKVTDEARQDSERIAAQLHRAGRPRRRAHQGPRRTTGSVACASSSSDNYVWDSATSRSRRPTNSYAPTSPTLLRKRRRSTGSSTSSTRWRRRKQ